MISATSIVWGLLVRFAGDRIHIDGHDRNARFPLCRMTWESFHLKAPLTIHLPFSFWPLEPPGMAQTKKQSPFLAILQMKSVCLQILVIEIFPSFGEESVTDGCDGCVGFFSLCFGF